MNGYKIGLSVEHIAYWKGKYCWISQEIPFLLPSPPIFRRNNCSLYMYFCLSSLFKSLVFFPITLFLFFLWVHLTALWRDMDPLVKSNPSVILLTPSPWHMAVYKFQKSFFCRKGEVIPGIGSIAWWFMKHKCVSEMFCAWYCLIFYDVRGFERHSKVYKEIKLSIKIPSCYN